jgi:predicted dehydrogenase
MLNVAIIGVGYWGPNLVRNFMSLDSCRVSWVCDSRQVRLDYIAANYPGVRTTVQTRDVLADSRTDAVVIATPVETHFDLAMSALKAGKHVFIEKPMTYSSEQDLVLLNLAEQSGLKIGTGHIFIYHPAVIQMKEILREKRIGAPYYAFSSRMNPSPSHGHVEVIWDLAVHDIAISLYLWGEKPESVRATGASFAHKDRIDVATVEMFFPDGTFTSHHVGWLTSAKERCFFLAGTAGSMKFDDMLSDKLTVTGPAIDTRLDPEAQKGFIFYAPGTSEVAKLPACEPLRDECENFVQFVLNGGVMASDGTLGHSVVQVLEAATRSVREGGVLITL